MTNETKDIVRHLKENNEDFEFYPTTREMIAKIVEDFQNDKKNEYNVCNFLDIGCGTCNFKKYFEDITREKLANYQVIEKSKYLIDLLDKDTIVLGTDFNECTLIDKPADIIFCNPPYSEYEQWMKKIIMEAEAKIIYMVIPERWRDCKDIQAALKKRIPLSEETRRRNLALNDSITSLGRFDFNHAERNARCTVEIIKINMNYNRNAYDLFFEETFETSAREQNIYDCIECENHRKEIKNKVISQKNKLEFLVREYAEEQSHLFDTFKTICKLDGEVLTTLGVNKMTIKEALISKIKNLKKIYWDNAFDILEPINTRLTTRSRQNLLDRYSHLGNVDFTEGNVYATIMWVIKNANAYFENQIVDLYLGLSSEDSIKAYKSNNNMFIKGKSRWEMMNMIKEGKISKYTLDYRIVAEKNYLPHCVDKYAEQTGMFLRAISDIVTVVNNMGFQTQDFVYPDDFGSKGTVKGTVNGKNDVLLEFRCYMNGNVHLKFNVEVMKALNVVAARILRWIVTPDDIKKEFPEEMAEGAEKYFNACPALPISFINQLLPERQNAKDESELQDKSEEISIKTLADNEHKDDEENDKIDENISFKESEMQMRIDF